jgi:hypothetical protein
MGPVRAASILAAWAEQKAVRGNYGLPAQPWRRHGAGSTDFQDLWSRCHQVMTENPYRLARDIRGIGFKTADAMAMKLGIEKNAIVRVRAGISYALTEAMDEGHRGLPTEELTPLAEKLLEVPQALIRTALDLELQEGTVVADRVGETPCVFLAGLHRAERTIAAQLMRLAGGMLPWPWIDPEKACRGSRSAHRRALARGWRLLAGRRSAPLRGGQETQMEDPPEVRLRACRADAGRDRGAGPGARGLPRLRASRRDATGAAAINPASISASACAGGYRRRSPRALLPVLWDRRRPMPSPPAPGGPTAPRREWALKSTPS